jgi:hypothetical protein
VEKKLELSDWWAFSFPSSRFAQVQCKENRKLTDGQQKAEIWKEKMLVKKRSTL